MEIHIRELQSRDYFIKCQIIPMAISQFLNLVSHKCKSLSCSVLFQCAKYIMQRFPHLLRIHLRSLLFCMSMVFAVVSGYKLLSYCGINQQFPMVKIILINAMLYKHKNKVIVGLLSSIFILITAPCVLRDAAVCMYVQLSQRD